MRHTISITYRNGQKDIVSLHETTWTIWAVRFTEMCPSNLFTRGANVFGLTPDMEPFMLRLGDVSRLSFHKSVGNPMCDADHYDNPLN